MPVDVDVLGDELPDGRTALRERGRGGACARCRCFAPRRGEAFPRRRLSAVVAVVADAQRPVLEDEPFSSAQELGRGLEGAVPGLLVEREGRGVVVFFFLIGLGLLFLEERRLRSKERTSAKMKKKKRGKLRVSCFGTTLALFSLF